MRHVLCDASDAKLLQKRRAQLFALHQAVTRAAKKGRASDPLSEQDFRHLQCRAIESFDRPVLRA
jgi:hypothetical protein